MEFALVTFPSIRSVRVDGVRLGQTGQVLRLQRGHHSFDLGNPANYTPPSVQVPLVNTGPTTPMVIAFQPGAFGLPGAVLAPPLPLAGKKKGAAKQKNTTKSTVKGGRRKVAKGGRRKVR